MNNFFKNKDNISAIEAQYEAQKIAFAPIIFQVVRTMRDLNVLKYLADNKKNVSIDKISEALDISKYGIQVLLETALSANVVKVENGFWELTKIGYFLHSDEMTNINMDYNHHVNYLGLFNLEESIKNEKAEGLKVFGEWDTIYPALSILPEEAKRSWFSFDHYYSDTAFLKAIEYLKSLNPKSILDIGGNTGKFALLLESISKDIDITIMDLAQQIKIARQNIYENNSEKITTIEANILLKETKIPQGFDIIWMSQFLDCFKEKQIVDILKKIKTSMGENSQICIMEPFWDRQNNETAAFCVINTSPYFTAMANGYSKMFKYTDFIKLLEEAGLEVIETIDNIGVCQTIIRCK
ncbi:MAG: SAM-dependent methyltransferase [Arcobacter sp.]|nr:MAG: SAM-dependent methyltransferase [Arcobacter sp.]